VRYLYSQIKIQDETEFWQDDVFKVPVYINTSKTFYSIYGDYIGRIASFLTVLLVILIITKHFIRKKIPGIS